MRISKQVSFLLKFFNFSKLKNLVLEILQSNIIDIDAYKLVFVTQLLVSRVHHPNENFSDIVYTALNRIASNFPIQVIIFFFYIYFIMLKDIN